MNFSVKVNGELIKEKAINIKKKEIEKIKQKIKKMRSQEHLKTKVKERIK